MENRLSFAARGLLAYLLITPENEKRRVEYLVTQSPAGRDAVQTIIRELKHYGYLEMKKIRKKGKFNFETVVYEEPQFNQTEPFKIQKK